MPPVTETATGVASARAPSSSADTVTVRSDPAASSATVDRSTVSVTIVATGSSSVIVSVTSPGGVRSPSLAASPDTVTCWSPPPRSLSLAVIVTVPLLVVSPASIVSTGSSLSVKSLATAGDTGDADTVTSMSSIDGLSRVAVTVLSPPSSSMESGSRTSVTAGGSSSSRILTLRPDSGSTLRPEFVVPVTATVTSGSSRLSSIGARVNVPVPLVSPAAIANVKPGTAV